MEIALVNGSRSLPFPGAVGQCQNCSRPMIAKCGEQLVWHWAHQGRRHCDAWWENEGPWHRAWKKHFPTQSWEIVGHDATGEKHIADIKLDNGLVIELQHSPITPEEMRSREEFYGHMVWIVDAEPFAENFWVFDPLPDPTLSFVDDLVFVAPSSASRNNLIRRDFNFDSLMFFRRSERVPGFNLVEMHSGRTLAKHFPGAYVGHHLFHWQRPREVWFRTTKPTYLDLGGGLVVQLMRYGRRPDAIWCVKMMPKQELIDSLSIRQS